MLATATLAGHGPGAIDRLVDDLIELQSENDATRQRLIERGWTRDFLEAHEAEARAAANQRFMRDIDAAPHRSLTAVQNDMADIIGALLPPTQLLVAELQARGFSAAHIDLLLHKARAKAALAFCQGQTGWAN